jgi:hypothetical protein
MCVVGTLTQARSFFQQRPTGPGREVRDKGSEVGFLLIELERSQQFSHDTAPQLVEIKEGKSQILEI